MKIEFKESFLKDLKKIKDKGIKNKLEIIISEVEKVKSILEIKNLKKLKGYKDFYRLRIGEVENSYTNIDT
ncbi:hypothetical protein GFV12_06870 [Desulfurobacterium thermolithotrophum]|uniref:hypothetical protein n=1 Tax=Desulfurobacterium thermolithotrophum TaxID=64160 RepID=UPI0013D6F0B1|nr:hypothetical protein [Desulfurobacterium thermolithotrophum]